MGSVESIIFKHTSYMGGPFYGSYPNFLRWRATTDMHLMYYFSIVYFLFFCYCFVLLISSIFEIQRGGSATIVTSPHLPRSSPYDNDRKSEIRGVTLTQNARNRAASILRDFGKYTFDMIKVTSQYVSSCLIKGNKSNAKQTFQDSNHQLVAFCHLTLAC